MSIRPCRFVASGLAVLAAIAVSLGVYTWLHWSPGAPGYTGRGDLQRIALPQRLRSELEHDAALRRNGGNPYVLHLNPAGDGELLYYGAAHTRDPRDPQVADIRTRWAAFRPTVALCEGRARGYFYGALIEPWAGLPEPALVHQLARQGNVPLYSLEPGYEAEVAALLDGFTPEQVALYFFLRVYWSEARGAPRERLAMDLLAKRTNVDGLRGALATLDDLDRVWRRDFPASDDWRTTVTEPATGYLAEISRASRGIRGEHMARVLIDLVQRGERVFAVVGSGHVIRQEWILREAFGLPPAWDQPRRE